MIARSSSELQLCWSMSRSLNGLIKSIIATKCSMPHFMTNLTGKLVKIVGSAPATTLTSSTSIVVLIIVPLISSATIVAVRLLIATFVIASISTRCKFVTSCHVNT
ncbi:hypothetical protein ACOSQ4_024777 [Xanthoceras sorbifolium]